MVLGGWVGNVALLASLVTFSGVALGGPLVPMWAVLQSLFEDSFGVVSGDVLGVLLACLRLLGFVPFFSSWRCLSPQFGGRLGWRSTCFFSAPRPCLRAAFKWGDFGGCSRRCFGHASLAARDVAVHNACGSTAGAAFGTPSDVSLGAPVGWVSAAALNVIWFCFGAPARSVECGLAFRRSFGRQYVVVWALPCGFFVNRTYC